MLETNDEWAVARRYMSLETLARIADNPSVNLPALAARSVRTSLKVGAPTQRPGTRSAPNHGVSYGD
ncbi:hypothetical protein [Aurantimonas manganoxydans]|uniref:hypothetical protein n=1 Tax=Aurantimonas manganoxydans TaxID=651183 RepID=UPI000322EADD|nr:hypothetical protein [Aurantimonas manganoxydans]